MKKIVAFLLMSASCSWVQAQTATVVKFDRIEKIMKTQADEVQVINFWATWCAPCVKELPLFEKLGAETPGVKVTLVNLDFADKIEKVNAFMARKNIKSETVLLDEIDYNTWIDKVDASWQGAIPATLIVNTRTGRRKFVERELADGELQQLIASVR
jgi:thiol-disulfide isomerase/thioredoxin